jgi:hypothetical protein
LGVFERYLYGNVEGELEIGPFRFKPAAAITIGEDECIRGSGYLHWCLNQQCIGPSVSFYICDFTHWGVDYNGLYVSIACPANLHVYDAYGRHVGLTESGNIDLEIPGAQFGSLQDTSLQYICIPGCDSIPGIRIEIKGLGEGAFDMELLSTYGQQDSVYQVQYLNKSIGVNSLARLNLGNNWQMQEDVDGDGIFETVINPDSVGSATIWQPEFRMINTSRENLGQYNVRFDWSTNHISSGSVMIGRTENFEMGSFSDSIWADSHSVVIPGLEPDTLYHYSYTAQDSSGFEIKSNDMWFRAVGSGCQYIPGDINGNGTANGIDIVYAVNYLKGGSHPPTDCSGVCPEPSPFYAAGDVNGNCAFNGIDITFFVRYLKGQVPSLLYCSDCPPAGMNPPEPAVQPIKTPLLKAPIENKARGSQ